MRIRTVRQVMMMIVAMTTGVWYPACPKDTMFTSYSDDEDETAELQRELEKIKRERAEKREQEVKTSILLCRQDVLTSG